MVFQPSFESLSCAFQCPDWFRDAKFGIWSHWGAQSVPMMGDWYARLMYCEGQPQYLHHVRTYGHPSKFGYKDICAMWKAERFDPEGLMQLFVDAGARYFVAQAMHHDNFFNYPSKFNPYNSAKMGPLKDIVGLWKCAAKAQGLPFGLTEHLAASFTFHLLSKSCDKYGPYAGVPYDGCAPQYSALYHNNSYLLPDHDTSNPELPGEQWYTKDKAFHQYWLNVMKEVIDLYSPDLLYSDGSLPFGQYFGTLTGSSHTDDPLFQPGLAAVAHLYNQSARINGENRSVYTQKDPRPEIYKVGLLDMERKQMLETQPYPWQTDTCIGGWFYNTQHAYKKPDVIIGMLVDIVSKNGNLLLNVPQRPDGTIDEEEQHILKELAGWFRCCGEGIYGTRPWRVFGEGESISSGEDEKGLNWTSSDTRYTSNGNTVYAFVMSVPQNRTAVLKSFTVEDKVRSVRLLGGAECRFEQGLGPLVVQLPQNLPTKYPNCLAISI